MSRLDELKEVDLSCPTVDELVQDITNLIGWRKAEPFVDDLETVRRINDDLRTLAYRYRYDADAAEERLALVKRAGPELIARIKHSIDYGEYYNSPSNFVDARLLLNELETLLCKPLPGNGKPIPVMIKQAELLKV